MSRVICRFFGHHFIKGVSSGGIGRQFSIEILLASPGKGIGGWREARLAEAAWNSRQRNQGEPKMALWPMAMAKKWRCISRFSCTWGKMWQHVLKTTCSWTLICYQYFFQARNISFFRRRKSVPAKINSYLLKKRISNEK